MHATLATNGRVRGSATRATVPYLLKGIVFSNDGRALSPFIVAAILDNAMPNHVTLFDLAVDPPALWDDQCAWLRQTTRPAEDRMSAGAHLTCTRVKKGVASLSH